MRYSKPHFYDTFECLADRCPDTCCAGWQIVIDEESLETYRQEKSAFGNRLANSIDWEEGTFLQYDRRCAFLNDDNFCDIYIEMSPDALCETCRRYPRHIEEYDGLREMSLSLSCPEAARIMLSCREKVAFETWETEEEEDSFEEDEMDFLLFTRLEDAREVMTQIIQNRDLDIRKRIALVEALAEEMQQCLDEYRDYEIDDLIREYEVYGATKGDAAKEDYVEPDVASRYAQLCEEFQVFGEMELLREQWGEMMERLYQALYAQGLEAYEEICQRFDAAYGCNSSCAQRWQEIGEQLMIFFVYTYFCGAVYDDWVAGKIRLAAFSLRWIQELVRFRWLEQGETLTMEDVIQMAWYYAREVEHSDDNLGVLDEWLEEHHSYAEDYAEED